MEIFISIMGVVIKWYCSIHIYLAKKEQETIL